jgi:ribonuclease J
VNSNLETGGLNPTEVPPLEPGVLRILPLGGLGEIGMNCMILEYGDEMVVIDCGLIFTDLDHFGVEFGIPDFTYLRENKDKIKAFYITHGHEDHVGALPLALKAGIKAPVYASPFTALLIRERLKEYGLDCDLRVFKPGERIGGGHFPAQTVSVNHSIVDSAALIIDTPIGKVIHTGDFKMDPTPFIGKTIDLEAFRKAGDEGVLLLMSDSTNVERHEHSISESVIMQKFEQLFAAAEGLTVVSMFASNVARMGQVITLAQKMGKKVALAGRTMDQNVRLGSELQYLKNVESTIIPLDAVGSYPRNEVIVLSTGSQGEYRSALIRMANGEHGQIKLQEGDLVLMSSKFIPGNEKAIGRMINNLFKQGAEVLYEAVHDIHTSGHATRPELQQMLEICRPRYFIPIHGEYRHLVHHAKLGSETGVKDENVMIAQNGDIIEMTKDSCEIVDHLEETRVLVEGREGGDISRIILKERRQLGEKGVVFTLLVRNADSRRIISGPEVITKGLASDETEAKLIVDAKKIAKRAIDEYDRELGERAMETDLQENIRVELRRYFNQVLGKKPTVIPIILDM